jgi:naphtho-gamma-pyrone polyketide synthase
MDHLGQPPLSIPPIADSTQSCQVFLFGDLTTPFENDLRQLLHVKGNETLRSFFDQVGFAFRQEFAKLPAPQQNLFPRFTTLVDLISKVGETEGTPALKFALLCLCEIGRFIRYEPAIPILPILY